MTTYERLRVDAWCGSDDGRAAISHRIHAWELFWRGYFANAATHKDSRLPGLLNIVHAGIAQDACDDMVAWAVRMEVLADGNTSHSETPTASLFRYLTDDLSRKFALESMHTVLHEILEAK